MGNLGLAFFETDLKDNRAVFSTNAYAMFGLEAPPPGTPAKRGEFWNCYHPDDREWARERFQSDLLGLRGKDTYRERVRIIRQSDHQVRWIEWFGRMFGPPGARTHTVGMLRDITEEVDDHERQLLLIREVKHRANNALLVVIALVQLTKGESVADYKAALKSRILSLSRTQSLLFETDGGSVDLDHLIRHEMAAYAGHATIAPCPKVLLKADAAQPVAMILHELATNSAKHGALSTSGSVTIDATLDDGDVVMVWTESGGPPVHRPTRTGTGLTVIQAQSRKLGGLLAQNWHPCGLTVELRFSAEQWCLNQSA
jgi:PAS domain S-box-containing protein